MELSEFIYDLMVINEKLAEQGITHVDVNILHDGILYDDVHIYTASDSTLIISDKKL